MRFKIFRNIFIEKLNSLPSLIRAHLVDYFYIGIDLQFPDGTVDYFVTYCEIEEESKFMP